MTTILPRRRPAWPRVVAWGVALVLVAAAGLKLAELVLPSRVAWLSWPQIGLGWAAVAYELALAGLLASGRWPRFAWAAATVTFLAFAGVAAAKVVAGAADCGCFGLLAVDPRITLILDLSAVAALLWAGPAGAFTPPRPIALAPPA